MGVRQVFRAILAAAAVAALAAAPAGAAEQSATPMPAPDVAPEAVGGGAFLPAPMEDSPAETESLSPDSVATVARIETYLNKLGTVHARFVQISSNGNLAEGEVHLQRPGKMRFEYDPPHPVLLIADGHSLLYYDRDLKNATFIPIEDSPLWFIVQPHIQIGGKVEVTDLAEEAGTITMTIRDTKRPDSGNVTLVFSDKPLQLHKWIVTDTQGVSIQVALIEPEFEVAMPKDLFEYGDLDVYGQKDDNRGR